VYRLDDGRIAFIVPPCQGDALSTRGSQMPIDGTWYNELGSMVEFASSGTSLTGMYQTKVGDASGRYPLVGFIDSDASSSPPPPPEGGGPAVGWVVLWDNGSGDSYSLTSWAGQYFPPASPPNGTPEMVVAMWLLRSELPEASNWSATQVGQDQFYRTQEIARQNGSGLAALHAPAHPVIHPL
jgi:hypothetical protein